MELLGVKDPCVNPMVQSPFLFLFIFRFVSLAHFLPSRSEVAYLLGVQLFSSRVG